MGEGCRWPVRPPLSRKSTPSSASFTSSAVGPPCLRPVRRRSEPGLDVPSCPLHYQDDQALLLEMAFGSIAKGAGQVQPSPRLLPPREDASGAMGGEIPVSSFHFLFCQSRDLMGLLQREVPSKGILGRILCPNQHLQILLQRDIPRNCQAPLARPQKGPPAGGELDQAFVSLSCDGNVMACTGLQKYSAKERK